MGSSKFLLGILAGVAVGAVLGILFAPEKGSDLRKKIYKKGEDFADGLKDKFDGYVDDITGKFEGAVEEFSEFTEDVKTEAKK